MAKKLSDRLRKFDKALCDHLEVDTTIVNSAANRIDLLEKVLKMIAEGEGLDKKRAYEARLIARAALEMDHWKLRLKDD